jgi:hypothetical protein
MCCFLNEKLADFPNRKASPKNNRTHNDPINKIVESKYFVKNSGNVLNDREFKASNTIETS